MDNSLFKEITFLQRLNVEDGLSNGNYPASTGYIDTQRFKRFGFIISCGALAEEIVAQVKQDTSATEADIKDITDALSTIADDDDDKWVIIEVDESQLDSDNDFRYVTLALSGISGSDYAAIFFFGTGANKVPVTQGADFNEAISIVSG